MTRNIGIHTFHIIGIHSEQICLWHCTYMFTAPLIWSIYGPNTTLHRSKQTTHCNFYLLFYYHICVRNKDAPQMPHMPFTTCAHETTMSLYIPHMNSLQSLMDQEHWIHTFHITDICSWTNIPATLHIYEPLYDYCSLHTDPTLLKRFMENQ